MPPKFKKGDRVRVLTWDEMLSRGALTSDTYGGQACLDLDDDNTNCLFLAEMKPACGMVLVIPNEPKLDEPERYPHEQTLTLDLRRFKCG